jgi:hypothetical protein
MNASIKDDDTAMDVLRDCAVYVGTRPMVGEARADFGRRLLADLDDRIEFFDEELRFRILAALNAGEI